MSAKPLQICLKCGTKHSAAARFCRTCGQPLGESPASNLKPQRKAPPKRTAGKAASMLKAAAVLRAVPWQVAVGDEIPAQAIQGILSVAVKTAVKATDKIASRALPEKQANHTGASLRGPAIRAFGGAVLETATSAIMGALSTSNAVMKIGLALVNLVAGLIAGERRGAASILMLLACGGLALLQGGSLVGTLLQLLGDTSLFGDLLPGGATQALSLLAALHAAWKTLKK